MNNDVKRALDQALGKGLVTMNNVKKQKNFHLTFFMTLISTILILGNPVISNNAFADATPTTVNSTANGYTNSKTITGTSGAGYNVTVSIYQGVTTSPLGTPAVQGQTTANSSGAWSFTANGLADGQYTVFATGTITVTETVTDPTTQQATQQTTTYTSSSSGDSFILDTVRPNVSPNLYPVPDSARIPTDTQIKIQFQDASPMDTASINDTIIKTFSIATDTGAIENVIGSVSYDSAMKNLIFTPSTPLTKYRTYYVSVDPNVKDEAGNLVHPRTWAFTTDETIKSGIVDFYTNAKPEDNPHGNYTDNVYICSNCHSTHRGTGPKLSSPVYPYIDSYCMACHDGTNAPIPENWTSNSTLHKHDVAVSMDGSKGTSGCTSCHDPHLTWNPNTDPNTDSNSSSLRGYYKYVHNDPTNPTLPSTSEQQLCEECHTPEPDVKNGPGVSYIQYTYLKQNTATGTIDSTTGLQNDYSLCFRCHDGKIGKDIASFYRTTSGHTIKADDGSPLNGSMPCADCHDTHASPNIKILKQKLGNNNIQGTFEKTTGDWDAATERIFCLKCHNNFTELYGKTIPFKTDIIGHNNTQSCTSCHGDGDFTKGAHAPKKLP